MDGIHAGVVSVTCVKPFDEAYLHNVASGARLLVTVEEHILRGGVYAAVAGALAGSSSHPRVLGFAVPEAAGKISRAGEREVLLKATGLSPEAIAGRIRSALQN